MREYFAWEHGLSEEVVARTLLLTGLLPPSMARRETLPDSPELAKLLVSRWERLRGRPWAWRLRASTARLIRGQDDVYRLVESANELFARADSDWREDGRGLRLEINIPAQFDPNVLYRTLLRGGAHSAFLRRKDEGEIAWSWPLRIGVSNTSQLLASVRPDSSLRPLFQEFHFEHAPMRANLLLFESSLSEVTDANARSQRRASTDAVIIFGGIGKTDTPLWDMLSLLSESTGAQGVFIFDALDEGRAQYATEGLIAYLSHDLTLDSAVAKLAMEQHPASVLSWATRSLVEATSVREQGRLLAWRLQQMRDARIRYDRKTFGSELEPPPARTRGFDRLRDLTIFGRKRRPTSTPLVKAKDLGALLEKRLRSPREASAEELAEIAKHEPISFEGESHGATTLAEMAKAVEAESDADAARREDRYLQARVETPAGRVIKEEARLLPSREYVACVFIGARDSEWLGLGEPLKTPEPPEGNPLILDVLFWEPQASPKPQVAQLKLKPLGNTKIVEFPFRTTEDQSIFSARIAVYHRNRNLQTGLLRGRVGKEPAKLQFTLDAAPQPKFVGLTDRAGVGASVIFNDDDAGNVRAFVFGDGEAGVGVVSDEPPLPVAGAPPLSVNVDPTHAGELTKWTEALGRIITRITNDPDDYEGLSKDGTRKLLLELAQHGSLLLARLRDSTLMGNLFDRVGYIQIVAAHVNAFFPIEYLYDGEPPEDDSKDPEVKTKVCGDLLAQPAADALKSGKCCGAYDADPYRTICPLRFWSLSKVIERHAHLPEHTTLGSQFQLRSTAVSARDRLLDPLRCAVVGASKKAATVDEKIVIDLRARLDAVLRTRPVPQAENWASLAEHIQSTRPNLLVLLPHHEQEGAFDLLEIGGDQRKSGLIRKEHVRRTDDSDTRPIVLLIGCQTKAAKFDLASFVPAFQKAGAVIVVSTIATILGRHAGPAAAAIVEELKKHEGNPNATFGRVMLAVRRRLLGEGIPMVLGLTSYGDADWRIEAPAADNQ